MVLWHSQGAVLLVGLVLKVKTNHHSLKYLLEKHIATPMLHEWLSKIIGFDFESSYHLGQENKMAVGLFIVIFFLAYNLCELFMDCTTIIIRNSVSISIFLLYSKNLQMACLSLAAK